MILGNLAFRRDTSRARANSASARLSYKAATVLVIGLLWRCGWSVRRTIDRRPLGPERHGNLGDFGDGAAADVDLLNQHQRLLDDKDLLDHRDDRGVSLEAHAGNLG